jgi:hypothetical protein
MSFFASAFSAIINAVKSIYRLVQRFIYGILSFKKHIVDWFQKYHLQAGRDFPFLVEGRYLKEKLHTAPKYSCGIFKGIYNEETDSITHHEFIGAEKLDSETKEVLQSAEEGLVVLQ